MTYLANLVESDMNFVDENKNKQYYTIGKGIIYFDNNLATLLVDHIEPSKQA